MINPRLASALVLTCFFIVTDAFATLLNGKVMSSSGEPVEYANVVLMNAADSNVVTTALTDESGKFKFENVSKGNYRIMIVQLGFERHYTADVMVDAEKQAMDIPLITLNENAVNLQEAQVTAMRPFIEHRIDKTVVNVENTVIDAGTTALDVLKRSPGVTVDNEGNISLSGKQGVMVMIDGKPSYLTARDLYELLRNMPSDQLGQIEIITNPSARYDAAGNSGVINFKMRKKQNTGLNGSAYVSAGQGVYPDIGSGLSLNFRNQKVNLFGAFDFMRGYYFERIDLTRRFMENGSTSAFRQHSFNKGVFSNFNYRGGADFYLNSRHTLGVLARGHSYVNDERSSSTTDILNTESHVDSGYVTVNEHDGEWKSISGNINYRYQIDTLGRELTADADVIRYDNGNTFLFITDYYYADSGPGRREVATNNQPATIDIRSFKSDYIHPFNQKIKMEAGIKSSYVTTDNDVQYFNFIGNDAVTDTGKTNHFKYVENINAAYVNFSAEHKKIGIQGGLRAEQTISEGEQLTTSDGFEREYIQLFPSLFFSYKFSDKHQARLSYSRRIDRPAYQQLNPFRYYIDPYNFMEGNPNLEPQLTNSFEASYIFKQMYSVSIRYRVTADAMTSITKQIDSTHTTFITTENLNENTNYGMTIVIPFHPFEWWQSSNNINIFNNTFAGMSSVGYVETDLSSYTFNSFNTFSLKKNYTIELSGYYNSRMVWGTWLNEPQFSISAGVSKKFREKFQVRLTINDIFHTQINKSKIAYQNINADFRNEFDTQYLRMHFTYNFGKQSAQRQRRSSAEDERSRIRQ